MQSKVSASASASATSKISTFPLDVGDIESHERFVNHITEKYGKLDCLVNNAAIAYKNADPTPHEQQAKPTLDINFRGTVDLTERMLPLLQKGSDARIVNVASTAGRLSQLSPELQTKFSSDQLTMSELHALVDDYERSVLDGSYRQKGWSQSNYGFSKLAVIAATRVLARTNPNLAINSCCPGYCKTDMTSQGGTRPPQEGARNAVIPATMENPPTGQHFANYQLASW
jgi:carbonyl reductase 1